MGTGYVRRSTTEIATGEVIEAADFNNEFNDIVSAFTASTGHSHDGTTAEGGNVTKLLGAAITIGDGSAGADIVVTFDGETTDGVLTWMEDEDHFKFSDDIVVDGTKRLYFNDEGGEYIHGDGTDLNLVSGADINIPANIGLTFGDDGEKIEGDGSDLTVSSSAVLTLDAGGGITIDADSGTITFADGGVSLGTITSSGYSGTSAVATVATTVTITDNESTNENNALIFTAGGDVDGGNLGLESDGTLTYNPSTGKVTATGFIGTLTGTADTATVATTVTITDNESTNEDNALIFTAGGDVDGGNLGLESDGTLTYNPSTGAVTATGFVGTTIELGHATDTTLARSGSGDVTIEGNAIYRAGGTDVPVADGGTGASSLTDGGVLLGSGTGAITAMAVLADGEMIVGDGSGDPVAESGATLRTSLGLGTGDSPTFTTVTASTSVIPDASGGADLGSTSAEWGDVYVADNKFIKLGSDQDFTIEYDEDGQDTTRVVAAGGVTLSPHGTSSGNTTALKFGELAAGGTNYVGFKAPDAIASDVTWTLPNADGSDGHVLKTNGSGALSFAAESGGAATGKNLIINGAMHVAQRPSQTGMASGYGACDGWQLMSLSGAPARYTSSQESNGGVDGNSKWNKILVTTADGSPAAADSHYYGQKIEGNSVQSLLDSSGDLQACTLSFDVYVHADGASSISFPATLVVFANDHGFGGQQYAKTFTVTSNDTWQRVSVPIAANTNITIDNDTSDEFSVGVTIYAGSGKVTSDGTWGSAAGLDTSVSGAENLADVVNNYLGLTNVQLEVGSVATDFEHEVISTTLAKCQRYFYRGGTGVSGGAVSTSQVILGFQFPQEMRTAPTAALIDTSISVFNTAGSGLTSSGSAIDYSSIKKEGALTRINGWSGGNAQVQHYPVIVYNNDPFITFSAEL